MPTVVAISDTHNYHRSLTLPEGDILIHAGDAGEHGTLEELEDFADWFRAQPHSFKVFVGGNHDGAIEENGPKIINGSNVHYLHDREIVVAGLRIYGSPYRVVPYDRIVKRGLRYSAFMITEVWAELVWKEIPAGLDILITHMPPYGIMDKTQDGMRWGSKVLLEAVQRTKPKYHIFGHIHDEPGIFIENNIVYVNVAMCEADKSKIPCRPIQILKVEKD